MILEGALDPKALMACMMAPSRLANGKPGDSTSCSTACTVIGVLSPVSSRRFLRWVTARDTRSKRWVSRGVANSKTDTNMASTLASSSLLQISSLSSTGSMV